VSTPIRHVVTAPVVLDARAVSAKEAKRAEQDNQPAASSANGVREWADLMGRAVLRLRMGDTSPLAVAVADLLEEETQGEHGADMCPGRKCPRSGPKVSQCPTELDEGYVQEDDHHHCRWCIARQLSSEHPEPASVRLARIVLEDGL
jgi:hypothetical protein